MISIIREREIIQSAGEAVKDNGFASLPIDPRKIAIAAKIELMPWKPERLGISGFLMRAGDDFGIGYSTAIQNEGFINFTIAHELGHYFLSGHVEAVIGNGSGIHYSESGFVSNDLHEREADAFAAELLMPQPFFKSALQQAGAGFNAIQTLAAAARTSIVATAIRFAKLADDPVAVILTTGPELSGASSQHNLENAAASIHWASEAFFRQDRQPRNSMATPLGLSAVKRRKVPVH